MVGVLERLLLLVALIGTATILRIWHQQIAQYGPDPSEMVLFYPPLVLCALAAFGSVCVAAMGVAHRHSTATDKQTT